MFAVSVPHAVQLASLFRKAGIAADYVVSELRDPVTGVTVSREDNERKLEEYRKGNLQVLVNVNILTEGVDLPKTRTVFLARPTVSTILMTQMVGRALRGPAAVMSTPFRRMVPRSAGKTPAMRFRVVDFPAPLPDRKSVV